MSLVPLGIIGHGLSRGLRTPLLATPNPSIALVQASYRPISVFQYNFLNFFGKKNELVTFLCFLDRVSNFYQNLFFSKRQGPAKMFGQAAGSNFSMLWEHKKKAAPNNAWVSTGLCIWLRINKPVSRSAAWALRQSGSRCAVHAHGARAE